MMGAAPALLVLALGLAAPQDPRAERVAHPAADVVASGEMTPPPRNDPSPGDPAVADPTVADARRRARARRLEGVTARLGTGLSARRSPDDREQPLIGPVSVLAGFGTVLIDIEVPN